MKNITERIKALKEKWKNLSKSKKIVAIIIIVGIISSLIALKVSMNKNKYGVLFSNMDSKDLGTVLTKLKEDKVDYKVEGSAIKVPKDQVDELRLQIPSEVNLTDGSVGFEIFDNNKFGMTDEEMNIQYQRALEGELERTIKSLPEVSAAKVHIVMSDNTVFVRETNPASASLTIKLNNGYELKKDQVKAIVALLCSSIKNLDEKNVEIIASSGNSTKLLTTPDLFTETDSDSVDTDEQQKLRSSVEDQLESKVQSMLEKVYGKNNVVVKINADLNFDAIQQNKVDYSPKGTVSSEHLVKGSDSGDTTNSSSPVDNQMVNETETANANQGSTNSDETRNYVVSSNEQKIIKAPGAVQKITTSVLVNGNIDEATKTSIMNLVSGTVGYNSKRGDAINIEGLNFDTSMQDKAQKDLDEIKKAEEAAKKKKLYAYIGLAAAAFILLISTVLIRKAKKRKQEMEALMENEEESIEPKSIEKVPPINLDEENDRNNVENEIKKYANKKPDQVTEIIKTWLAEDER